jgi:hypothetical protein
MRPSARRCGWISASLLACGALACSGNDFSNAPPTTKTVAEACQDLATARCNLRVSCTNGIELTGAALLRAYGDMDTCLAREALACQNQATAAGSGANPPHIEQCATAVMTEACADFFDNVPPPACLPGGSRAADEACAFNSQCTSGYCGGTRETICGSCGTAPGAGASCETSNCGRDLVCVESTNLCQARSDTGAACSSAQPCRSDLNCVASADDATVTTCQAAGASVGAPCGTGTSGCDGQLGLYCGGTKGARVCAAVGYATDGMACGMLADGSHVQCVAGDCYTATGLAAATDLGTCKAFAADGMACDSDLGPTCSSPARCVTSNGSVGVCTVAIGASCD